MVSITITQSLSFRCIERSEFMSIGRLRSRDIIVDSPSSTISESSSIDMDRSDSGSLIVRKLSDENLTNLERVSVLGFTTPLSTKHKYDDYQFVTINGYLLALRWFFSVAGTEYCHTYFWIGKDLAWMQGWR